MSSPRKPPELADRLKGLFNDPAASGERPARGGRRARLPIPVRAKVGQADSRERRLRDVSTSGLLLDWNDPAEPGQPVVIRFDGYPEVCGPFLLHGKVVRVVTGRSPAVGIAIDRQATPAESLTDYRRLVLHYLRHRPLLDELDQGFFEGRCTACGWLGRVGVRNPACPCCKERVEPLTPAEPQPPPGAGPAD